MTNDIIKGCLFSSESNGLDAIKYAFGNKISAEKLWRTNNELNLFNDEIKVDILVYFVLEDMNIVIDFSYISKICKKGIDIAPRAYYMLKL